MSIVYNYETLRHAITKKMTSFPKRCICLFWVNKPTRNLTGWKRWILMEKLMPFDEIYKSTNIVRYMWIWIANKFAKFQANRLNRSENISKSFRCGATFFETPCRCDIHNDCLQNQHRLALDITGDWQCHSQIRTFIFFVVSLVCKHRQQTTTFWWCH